MKLRFKWWAVVIAFGLGMLIRGLLSGPEPVTETQAVHVKPDTLTLTETVVETLYVAQTRTIRDTVVVTLPPGRYEAPVEVRFGREQTDSLAIGGEAEGKTELRHVQGSGGKPVTSASAVIAAKPRLTLGVSGIFSWDGVQPAATVGFRFYDIFSVHGGVFAHRQNWSVSPYGALGAQIGSLFGQPLQLEYGVRWDGYVAVGLRYGIGLWN